MLRYRDFVPKQVKAPRLSFDPATLSGEYESFQAAVEAANNWIATQKPRVVNIETVTLPNLDSSYEGGSDDASIAAGELVKWHQFVRVWYED
jgi:hypothetical protein